MKNLKRVLTETFITYIGRNGYFTFNPCLFRWCLSLGAFIPVFPPRAPSFLSKFSLKVSMGVCLCYEGPCPPCTSFNFFRNHFCFTSFSSFRFILAMFKFFDGILTKSRQSFLFSMFKPTFIHSIHLLVRGLSCMVFEDFRGLFDPEDSTSDFS